jgi:hypothetical protein
MDSTIPTKKNIGNYDIDGIKFIYSLYTGNIISSPTLLKDY